MRADSKSAAWMRRYTRRPSDDVIAHTVHQLQSIVRQGSCA